MPLPAPRYLLLDTFKSAVFDERISSPNDAIYQMIITSVEEAIDNYCERTFDPAGALPTQVTMDLQLNSVMYIPDVVTIESIKLFGSDTPLGATEWQIVPRARAKDWCRIRRLHLGTPVEWPYPFLMGYIGQMVMSARFGYGEDVPATIINATLRAAINEYQQRPFLWVNRDNASGGDVMGGMLTAGEEPTVELTPDIIAMLDAYKRPTLGAVTTTPL
jgi:hypothetical protein